MITRVWTGRTVPENADAYQALLETEIFPWIRGKSIAGLKNLQLLRRDGNGLSEFMTLMLFDSLDAVIAFAGADYAKAVVPEKAQRLLKDFDDRAAHYTVIV